MEESLLVPTCNYLHVRASGRNKDRTETNREGNLFCYPGDKRFGCICPLFVEKSSTRQRLVAHRLPRLSLNRGF